MTAATTGPGWWQRLAERAAAPPLRPRRALHLAGFASPVGSVEIALTDALRGAGLGLRLREDGAAELAGPPDAALAGVAAWLHAHGLAARWRGELLPVTDGDGVVRAAIERAAVRPLGITTFAVHLIGFDAQGGVWVQQRAFDKATDPGQWDTLVGGLASAHETAELALERETWEEAGLRLGGLTGLQPAGRLVIRRPVSEGYMVERIDAYEAVLPAGAQPVNQDGEVERFECLMPAALVEQLGAGRFTLEAGLLLAASLRRRGVL